MPHKNNKKLTSWLKQILKFLAITLATISALFFVSCSATILYVVATYEEKKEIKFEELTKEEQYFYILKKWPSDSSVSDKLIDHFPKKFPLTVLNSRVGGNPKILQGIGWFQLYIELAPEEISRLYRQAKSKAVQSHDGGHIDTLKDKNFTSTNFYISDTENLEFPDHFRVFIFDNKEGNHGFSKGIAISLKANAAVYWATAW